MKKLLLSLLMSGLILASYSQNSSYETMSFGLDSYRYEAVGNPIVRYVTGGGIIKVKYVGDEWKNNVDRKNAFEHACRIWEEQLPTPIPIVVEVSFGTVRGNNALASTTVYTESTDERRVELRSKIKRQIFKDEFPNVYNLNAGYFNDPDGKIMFSNSDIFSYSLDYVKEDKYDFVTVALQELTKIFGFYFDITASNIDKQLKIDRNAITRFDELVLPYDYMTNPSGAYAYATSGNVVVYMGESYLGNRNGYKMYAPTVFENKRSLSFFAVDNTNKETKLMQPDLPRGTSIRYIGKGLKAMLESTGWLKSYPVGMGNELHEAGSVSTDAAIDYNQSVSFGVGGSRSNIISNPVIDKPASRIVSGSTNGSALSWIENYLDQFKDYPKLNLSGSNPTVGWSVSILRKDGTWEILVKEPDLYPTVYNQTIKFSTSMIDVNKAKNYARSSDGYLRCRISYNDGVGYSMYYQSRSFSKYFLLDYLPQIPEMALAKVLTSNTKAVMDDYYVDVKIAFKNVEGTERILVEQLEEGETMPFTYYVDNVKDGYFIANVDKEYKTTFRLRAINKNGVTVSEQLVVSPIGKPIYKFDPVIQGDWLTFQFKDNIGNVSEFKQAVTYRLSNLANPTVYQNGNVSGNILNVSSMPSGVYGIQVIDEQSNVYNAKFIK